MLARLHTSLVRKIYWNYSTNEIITSNLPKWVLFVRTSPAQTRKNDLISEFSRFFLVVVVENFVIESRHGPESNSIRFKIPTKPNAVEIKNKRQTKKENRNKFSLRAFDAIYANDVIINVMSVVFLSIFVGYFGVCVCFAIHMRHCSGRRQGAQCDVDGCSMYADRLYHFLLPISHLPSITKLVNF